MLARPSRRSNPGGLPGPSRDADPPDGSAPPLAWVREHFGGTDTVGAVAADGRVYVTDLRNDRVQIWEPR